MFNLQPEIPNPISPRQTMLQMLRGFQISQCIYAATKLGIVDLLEDGAKHYDQLATETNTDPDSLYRLLRTLASLKILQETQPNYFQNTVLASYLRDNQPGNIRNFLITEVEESYACWGNFIESVKTGKGAFESFHGVNIEEYHQQNPTQNQVFDQAMIDITAFQTPLILAAYDFSTVETIADIGGGQGKFLAAILHHYPHLKGILFEQPYSLEQAKILLTKESVINRCELISGDFFESIPVVADIYLLKKILLNWEDEEVIKILKRCHETMPKKSRLLIIDRILQKNRWQDNFADLNLWMISSGRIRTELQFRVLLEAAGFEMTQIIATESIESLIEATP
jgi:hypothetical protein